MCGVEEGITQMASSSGSTANGSVVRTDAARPSLRTALERVWPYLPAPAPGVELPHRRHLSLDVPTRMVTHTDAISQRDTPAAHQTLAKGGQHAGLAL